MGNTNYPAVGDRINQLDLSALDGLSSKAAAKLRAAVKDFAAEHGVAALKTALSTLNSENTTPAAPTNSVAPSFTGTTTVGQQLTGAAGTWAGFPTPDTTYQWYRADTAGGTYAAISGATALNYTLQVADATKYVKLGVTKTNANGTLEVLSAASAQIAAS